MPYASNHTGPRYRVREVGWKQPFSWLQRGLMDLLRCPLPGLAHGLAMTTFAVVLMTFARERFWVLAAALSAFLIVAPILATGIYFISQALEQGEWPSLEEALSVWVRRDPRMVTFGLLLGLAGAGWILTSAALVTRFAPRQVNEPLDFILRVVLQPGNWLFETWLALGALLAAPIFASSVVSMPMLLDTRATVKQAVLTSWQAVLASPGPLALWAALILALMVAGMATMFIGLAVTVPWVAHASWHAYRDLVENERGIADTAPVDNKRWGLGGRY